MIEESVIDILLVEDNPEDEELTVRALKKNNIANCIFIARDGAEALDFIFGKNQYDGRNIQNQPKVILLDLKLPKIDGLEVLRSLKSNESTKSIPVVVLTSSNQEKDMIESYKLGVNSYLLKPVNFDQFIKCISEVGLYWLILNKRP